MMVSDFDADIRNGKTTVKDSKVAFKKLSKVLRKKNISLAERE